MGGDNVRWLGETSDGSMWAVMKPGSLARIDPATAKIRLFGRAARAHLRDCRTAVSSTTWTGCGLRQPAASFATTGRLFPDRFQPHRSTRIAGARGVGLFGRQTGDHVDHQSRRVVETERWPVAPVPESRRAPERQPIHHRPSRRTALSGCTTASMPELRRVEFSGDRIVRSTPVLPAEASSVEVTAFHGFDALGRLWRGSANGVSVLAGGSWRYLSTEDGLIWNDTDGEAFWADARWQRLDRYQRRAGALPASQRRLRRERRLPIRSLPGWR